MNWAPTQINRLPFSCYCTLSEIGRQTALSYLQKALGIARAIQSRGDEEAHLGNIAASLNRARKNRMTPMFPRSRASADGRQFPHSGRVRLGDTRVPQQTPCNSNGILAMLNHEIGNTQKAEESYKEAISIAQSIGANRSAADALTNRARQSFLEYGRRGVLPPCPRERNRFVSQGGARRSRNASPRCTDFLNFLESPSPFPDSLHAFFNSISFEPLRLSREGSFPTSERLVHLCGAGVLDITKNL
jgi:hypothetical protein